jgi:hypothetical protein
VNADQTAARIKTPRATATKSYLGLQTLQRTRAHQQCRRQQQSPTTRHGGAPQAKKNNDFPIFEVCLPLVHEKIQGKKRKKEEEED